MAKAPKPSSLDRELTALEHYTQISTGEVARLFGWTSNTSVWAAVKEGKIPKPRYLRPHQPMWRLGELIPILEAQPGFDEAIKGFKGHARDEESMPVPKKETKRSSVWDRLGLKRPK